MAKIKILTTEQLESKTVIELRELCKKYNISGLSKARKDVVINALEALFNSHENVQQSKNNTKIPFINAHLSSVLQKDDTYKTLVSVSCGAASNNYPVVGRSVGYVKATYREILNIDEIAEGLVNGIAKSDSYILQSLDVLEFVRKAGIKG